MENEEISISHWGIFFTPKHEPEVTEARRKRIEKLLFPIVEQIVDIKV
jgi:hypothetical protein